MSTNAYIYLFRRHFSGMNHACIEVEGLKEEQEYFHHVVL